MGDPTAAGRAAANQGARAARAGRGMVSGSPKTPCGCIASALVMLLVLAVAVVFFAIVFTRASSQLH